MKQLALFFLKFMLKLTGEGTLHGVVVVSPEYKSVLRFDFLGVLTYTILKI